MAGESSSIRRLAMKTVLAAREVVDLGPDTAAAIVTNSFRTAARGRRDRQAEGGPAVTRTPGRLLSAAAVDGGLLCWFAEAELEVRFLREDLVRLTWGPGEEPLPWALAGELVGPAPDVEVTVGTPGAAGATAGSVAADGAAAGPTGAAASTAGLRVEVGEDGDLWIRRPDGTLLRHELPPLRRGATRTAREALRPGERVAGLGEQAGPVDLRGATHRLWNRDPGGAWGPGQDPLYCGVPVTVGLHPDGDVLAFYDNPYEAVVRVTGERVEAAFAGGVLRHYVAAGPLPLLLDRYSELTGRPPLPPRWSLGYHQCKWGYKTEADVREVADGFRDEEVPLSAVHLDIDHMEGYRIFTVDPARFPDLPRLADDLAGRGTRLVAIVDPAVKIDPEYDVYREGAAAGHFLFDQRSLPDERGEPLVGVVWPGRAAFPDFTDPATRVWWGGHYRRLLDQGVAGIWHDMNEPTSITLWGDRTLPRGTPHAAEGRGGDHRQCHNVYGHLMNRVGWEAQAAARPERRPWVLSRSGWAGLQRWAWNWTADIESSWAGLRQQIPTAIGLGLSGVPYTGSDTGGFSGIPDPELFVRWLEMAVLMPFCRTHCVMGSPNREPWRFPEPFRGMIDELIRFRYRLLPYLYTLAHEASRAGQPLVRPLSWPTGRGPWCDDAYLLGDALLVAPVSEEGAGGRAVPLPEGRWYHWRPLDGAGDGATRARARARAAANGTGGGSGRGVGRDGDRDGTTLLEGGRTVDLAAPLGHPLVLVRAGSVLPLDDGRHRGPLSAGHEPLRPAVHCFPAADGTAAGAAYDDAGDGHGPVRLDRFTLVAGVLRWEREGGYDPPARLRVVVHGDPAADVEHGPFDELDLR